MSSNFALRYFSTLLSGMVFSFKNSGFYLSTSREFQIK